MADLAERLVQTAAAVLPVAYDTGFGIEPGAAVPSTQPEGWEAEARAVVVALLREQITELDVWIERIKANVTDRKTAACQQLGLRLCRLRLIEAIDQIERSDTRG